MELFENLLVFTTLVVVGPMVFLFAFIGILSILNKIRSNKALQAAKKEIYEDKDF